MTAPRLTVALLVPNDCGTIRRTVSVVAGQDIARQIELLVLGPRVGAADIEHGTIDAPAARAFHSVRYVTVDLGAGSGDARAIAVREAAAPVIVFAEDHCFPEPGWARALVEAHDGPWAAVGPVVLNANPARLVSWADLLMGYGPWLAPGTSREHEHLPGHNCSYKREPLLAFGDELPELMEAETVLHWRLRAGGHRLWQESRARVAHTNFERWGTWLFVTYHAGRVFAAMRALEWPLGQRVAFALASPLIPLVRLVRHLRQGAAAPWPMRLVLAVAPTLAVGLVVNAAGQALGCLAGAGRSRAIMVAWEFARNAAERPTVAAVQS